MSAIKNLRLHPHTSSALPVIESSFEIEDNVPFLAYLQRTCALYLGDTLLSTAVALPNGSIEQLQYSVKSDAKQSRANFSVLFQLTDRAVSFMHNRFSESPRKELNLRLECRSARVKAPVGTATLQLDADGVTRLYSDEKSADSVPHSSGTVIPLLNRAYPVFAEFMVADFKWNYTIHTGAWLHDFCPSFRIGRFLSVNLPLPEPSGAPDEKFGARLHACVKAMSEAYKTADWYGVILRSRGVFELLRTDEALAMLASGDESFSPVREGFKNFTQSVFTVASKYIHETGTDKELHEVRPIPRPEEGELCYATALTAANLFLARLKSAP